MKGEIVIWKGEKWEVYLIYNNGYGPMLQVFKPKENWMGVKESWGSKAVPGNLHSDIPIREVKFAQQIRDEKILEILKIDE